MKKTMELAGITAASVIGAGFATGREVRAYFTKHGNLSYFIIAGVAVLLYLGGVMLLNLESISGKIPSALYVYFGYILMLAALGQLVNDYTGLPNASGVMIGSFVALLGLGAGFNRFVKFSGKLTPVVAVALIFILVQAGSHPSALISEYGEGAFFSVINFTGYNFLSMLVILPEIKNNYKRKEKLTGVAVGILMPIICMYVVNEIFLRNYYEIWNCQMPLINIICSAGHKSISLIAVTLLTMIFLLSLCGLIVGFSRMLSSGRKEFKTGVIFVILAVPLSFFGFGKLMDFVYPAFGIVGMVMYGWVLLATLTIYGKKLIL